MKLLSIKRSTKKDKKLMATFYNDETGRTKIVHFGSSGMDDYTITKDKDQRERYIKRHKKDLLTKDPTRAGYLAMEILWGKSPSRRKNISDFKKKYHL